MCSLGEGDDTGDEDDDDEDEAEDQIGQVAVGLDDKGDDAENGSHPEHDCEPVGQFLQETDPGRSLLLLRQLVISLL